MADNQERHYNILKLNRTFAISSLVFFAVWILVFVYDFQRPWKKYQIEFRELEIEKIRQELPLTLAKVLIQSGKFEEAGEMLLEFELEGKYANELPGLYTALQKAQIQSKWNGIMI